MNKNLKNETLIKGKAREINAKRVGQPDLSLIKSKRVILADGGLRSPKATSITE